MGGEGGTAVWPILIIGVAFVAYLIWSQRRNQKKAGEFRADLKPGDRVLLQHGQYATIVSIDKKEAFLEVAPGVVSQFLTGAIARKVTPEEAEEAEGVTAPDDASELEPAAGERESSEGGEADGGDARAEDGPGEDTSVEDGPREETSGEDTSGEDTARGA